MEKPSPAMPARARAAAPPARLRALALIAASLIAAAPCAAAPARLSASLGFAGTVVPGRWNPLWARCDGEAGEARIEVVLRSADGSSIGTESFPCRDGLRIECPVMVDERLQSVSVRLVSSGQVLAEQKVNARAKLFPGHVVLAVGEGFDAEIAISSALYPSEPIQAVSLGLSDLPSMGLDYDAVSAIAIRDPGRALAPAQRDAMASWISGGGRLVVTRSRAAGEGIVGSLVGASGASGASRTIPFGLGSIFLAGEPAADEGPGGAERRWRAALALSPYGKTERLAASRVFKSPADSFARGPESTRAEIVILVALALWAGVVVIASRNRRKSIVPLAAAAAASLAFAAAGAPGLDSMLRRGARSSARAFVLPGEGFALVSIGVRTAFGDSLREFASVAAVRGLEVEYGSLERGLMGTAGGADFDWSHELPASSLSLRSSSRDALDLAGILEPDFLEGSGFPSGALAAARSRELPELESSGRLAFASAGPGEASWLSRKDGRWVGEQPYPTWLGADVAWIEALRALAPGRSFLVGRCSAPALRLKVGGSAASEILWAMPVAAGPAEARGREARP